MNLYIQIFPKIIPLIWRGHNVSNSDANGYILQTIAETKGLTTIAPTWFSLADTEGNVTSLADADYVKLCPSVQFRSLGSAS